MNESSIERGYLRTTSLAANDICKWTPEYVHGDTWETSCGKYFTIIDGTPKENKFKYCCYCGKPIAEEKIKE